MKSDTDPEWEAAPRVLFRANQKNEINRTEAIVGDKDVCFNWSAYIRVSNSLFEYVHGNINFFLIINILLISSYAARQS